MNSVPRWQTSAGEETAYLSSGDGFGNAIQIVRIVSVNTQRMSNGANNPLARVLTREPAKTRHFIERMNTSKQSKARYRTFPAWRVSIRIVAYCSGRCRLPLLIANGGRVGSNLRREAKQRENSVQPGKASTQSIKQRTEGCKRNQGVDY